MFRNAIVSATFVALMSGGALAATSVMVQEIDAQVDLTSLTNPLAAERYGNIAGDLESALAALLTDRIADVGVVIMIDISEVELSDSFLENMNVADTHLVGDVSVFDKENNGNHDSYKLTVDINQAMVFFPEGIDVVTLTASSDTYYDAMIAAFAQGVFERLPN